MSSVAWVARGTGDEISAAMHIMIKQHAVSNKAVSQVIALFTLKLKLLQLHLKSTNLSAQIYFMNII